MDDILVCFSCSADGRVVPGKAQGQRAQVELAAVDGIRTGFADETGSQVLQAPFVADAADCNDTIGFFGGYAVDIIIGTCASRLGRCAGYGSGACAQVYGIAQRGGYVRAEDLNIGKGFSIRIMF